MRKAIRTAPRDGKFVVLEEETSGISERAQWSAGTWIGENGAPVKLRPTHWRPFPLGNVVVHPSAGENRATELSRPLMVAALLGGILVGILALKAGALFVSPVSPDGRSAQTPAASSPGAAMPQAKPIAKDVEARIESGEAQALIRERQRAAALARDLGAARREIEARTALPTGAAEATEEAAAPQLRQALEGEREQVAALSQELAAARQESETRRALATAADRETAEIRQAGEAAARYLQQALEDERTRVAALTRELAAARQDIEARAATASKAAEAAEAAAAKERLALEEERTHVTSLTRELAVARQEIEARVDTASKATEAGEAAAAQQRQALEEERTRVTSLARELAVARQEIEARGATASKAAEAAEAAAAQQRLALEQQRTRVASLARELAAARQEIEARAAAARKAAEVAEAAAAQQRQALEEERHRANTPAGEPAAAPRTIEVATGAASPPDTRSARIETNAALTLPTNKDTGVLDRPASAETHVAAEAQKLLARAGLFQSQGDISAARIVLERALDMGSAEAGYRLAETYDPKMLSLWRTLGTRGDPAKARELYARAYADGIEQAKDRMNALP